jgi:hypothetical protein
MFHKDPLKDWSFSHLVHCGEYLNYLKDNILSFEILLQKKNEINFQEVIVSSTQPKRGGGEMDLFGEKKGQGVG